MIPNNYKNSLLIPSQLPEFIRDNPDYSNFVTFLQAYYEWLEQTDNVEDRAKNILNYIDIDRTSTEFLQYYINDFLQYFPSNALLSEQKAVKIARELYQKKGTPSSYQFLFRVLYNSDFQIFYTKDAVLKASNGIWYVPRSLKLASSDTNFLTVNNLRVFGETSKSIATIENVVLAQDKVEVFISNIERLFQSGEFVRVVDNNNQDVLFNGQPLVAKIVGQISAINIDPSHRGLLYQPGNPVVVYGGLNSNTGYGANAVVGSTTSGAIQRINVLNGGYGYSLGPNPLIPANNFSLLNINGGGGAIANIASVDVTQQLTINVPSDTIQLKSLITLNANNFYFANIANSNINSIIAQTLTYESINVAPISSIIVNNGGGGINTIPTVTATSYYNTDIPQDYQDLSALGILAPIIILNGGNGYTNNDTIVISGGSGIGANAIVTSVSNTGAILSVAYNQPNANIWLGGIGYTNADLPTVTVISANNQASNASLYVPGILGTDATFSLAVDRVGSITTINLIDGGEDYVAAPNVSLKVQDILVSNISLLTPPTKLDTIYQGANINVATYQATVNSFVLISPDNNPANSVYSLRVFNYNSIPDNNNGTLNIDGKNIHLVMTNTNVLLNGTQSSYNPQGIITYGDGNALANAQYLNGLVIGQGQYLSTAGQPSSYDVLQSSTYNNYTYIITVEKEIARYRDMLLNLLHPAGLQVLGRYAIKSESAYDSDITEGFTYGYPLAYYFNTNATVSIEVPNNFTVKSNNIIRFNNIGSANIAQTIFNGTYIEINSGYYQNVYAQAISVDYANNEVEIDQYVWLAFSNVFTASANSGNNYININSVTNSYNLINGGNYSNVSYPMMDIVHANDWITFNDGNIYQIASINYTNNTIYLTSSLTNSYNVSNVSVTRGNNYISSDVQIYGTVGLQYIPEFITESGNTIITESGSTLLIE